MPEINQAETTRILITVEGGNVTSVLANVPKEQLDVEIIDYDNKQDLDPEKYEIEDGDGTSSDIMETLKRYPHEIY